MATALALRALLMAAGGWFLLWGIGALIARVLGAPADVVLAAGLAGTAIVAVLAAGRGIRSAPGDRALLSFLDARQHCGGLAAASADVPLGGWSLPNVDVPAIRWNARKKLLYLAGCAAFVIGAMLIPIGGASSHHTLQLGADAKRLEEKIELLQEEKIIPPERADALQQTVEELKTNAAGDDPAKAWETLDAVDDAVTKAAGTAAEDAIRKGETLSQLEAMASVAAADPAALADLLRAAESAAPHLGTTDPGKIGAAARQSKAGLRNRLAKLAAKGMIDPKSLRKFDNPESSELARYLREHRSGSMAGPTGRPGRGGVDRGRGDAPLFFGEETQTANEKFKDHALPPATAASLEDSQLVGMSATAPQQTQMRASAGGALTASGGAGSAYTTTVLPRHRGTVGRFFERTPK
ncbi:MAG TPA: hypothetical protein VJ901_15510 [Thermoanaerobaculia bacterium]|nr:hypothetical protein [Thermoanaerobaculia bacterium]